VEDTAPPGFWRPSREQVAAAAGRTIRDVTGPHLRVLFCGINPSLYSGAVGHHFARPGNRFWKALFAAGFTDRVLSPFEDGLLPAHGLGVTNLVYRATAGASELTREELRRGARRVERLAVRLQPGFVAFLGLGAYRTATGKARAVTGLQTERMGPARVWLLPNPSGLNAGYQLSDLAEAFGALCRAARPS
jgi:double-stranded uracil-DNA glycosylase